MRDEILDGALEADLLLQALTHYSYAVENPGEGGDNERLEFLGDAVIGFIASDFLYRAHPGANEGELTRRKAILVRKKTLARFARELGLPEMLRLGRGGEDGGKGRQRDSILASSFEALVGAVFTGLGMEKACSFFTGILQKYMPPETTPLMDSKSSLQEYFLRHFKSLPRYQVVHREGPPHRRHFTVEVSLGGRALAVGCGYSKQEAEQQAAAVALRILISEKESDSAA